jgi:hypothetical protein
MTRPATDAETMDRALEAICMLLMPFFTLGAGDDPEKARRAVANLIRAYNPTTSGELDLAARVIGFGAAALDNLCISMSSPDMSDTKVLRYRSAAVSLSRSAEQCRVVLQKMQNQQPEATPAPGQRAEKPDTTTRPPTHNAPTHAAQTHAAAPRAPAPRLTTGQIEKAKSDARTLLAGLAKAGIPADLMQDLATLRITPDTGAQISAAVTAALAAHQVPTIPQNPART